jgi:hypothetical protein
MRPWRHSSSILNSVAIALVAVTALTAQSRVPRSRLISAPRFELPAEIDSSNPAVWSLIEGVHRLFVISSWGGIPVRSVGESIESLRHDGPVDFARHPGHGVWIESIIPADDGEWYAYYHHERAAELCGRADRQLPRIGALRSADHGRTWEDLGIVLDVPESSFACESANRFVLGGVGDVTAAVDAGTRDIYLYFSQYARDAAAQGVAAARLAWADRDDPVGKVSIWNGGAWLSDGHGTPLVNARQPFHDRSPAADVFWGPSIHWNTYLEQYVMLLNRARDDHFNNEGIYVSYSPTLTDPSRWTTPVKLMDGGGWYPQVIGMEPGAGTDRIAGKRARFFLTGRSERYIEFDR